MDAILLGVITNIGGFLFGYGTLHSRPREQTAMLTISDTGQISGMLLFDDFVNRFGQGPEGDKAFQPIIQSLLVSLMSIGTLIGALSGAYTADWWGRRRSLSFGVAVFIVGNVLQITAMNHWAHITVGRFVAGLGVGGCPAILLPPSSC